MVKRLSGRAILFIENLMNQAIETFMLYKLQNWLFVTAFIKRKNIKPKQQKKLHKKEMIKSLLLFVLLNIVSYQLACNRFFQNLIRPEPCFMIINIRNGH